MKKKVLLGFIVIFITFSCGEKGKGGSSDKLVVWSFTDELGDMISFYSEEYPDVDIEFMIIPNQDEIYLNKIITTLRSRSTVPDVFTGERAWFRQLIDADFWEPISDPPYNAEELTDDLTPYVIDLSRDSDRKIAALSWQATPGGLFYRRSIAKDILGTDSPDEVSRWTSDLNKFYELGEMIKDGYGGSKFLLAGFSDMSEFIFSLREKPYVENGTLTIPYSLVEYMLLAKKMRENRIEAGTGTWSPPWFSSMADGSVFAYILPTWGLHYVLKPNAEPDANEGSVPFSGDWGLAVPPASYSWGGTWIGINKNSKNKELAWEFVKYIGSNTDFQKKWAEKTGDFVSNLKVVDEIKGEFSEPFLGGQNHYDYFFDEARKVDVSYVGPWDFQIQNAWADQVDQYANGEKSFEQAIDGFKAAAAEIFPNAEVIVEMGS